MLADSVKWGFNGAPADSCEETGGGGEGPEEKLGGGVVLITLLGVEVYEGEGE